MLNKKLILTSANVSRPEECFHLGKAPTAVVEDSRRCLQCSLLDFAHLGNHEIRLGQVQGKGQCSSWDITAQIVVSPAAVLYRVISVKMQTSCVQYMLTAPDE